MDARGVRVGNMLENQVEANQTRMANEGETRVGPHLRLTFYVTLGFARAE